VCRARHNARIEAAKGAAVHVFISYAREDRSAVEALTADLTALGHEVWYDGQLMGGQHWWDEILRRIAACDIYAFGLSGTALDSGPCMAELAYAQSIDRPLLPVQLAAVPASLLPSALAEAQFVDYTAADKRAAFALNAAINQMPAQTPLPDPLPAPPVLPKSKLHDLKQQIDSPDEMTRTAQLKLVDDLAHELRVKDQRADVVGLLRRFRSRLDVMGDIRDRIDTLVESVPAAAPAGAAPAGAASTGATTQTAGAPQGAAAPRTPAASPDTASPGTPSSTGTAASSGAGASPGPGSTPGPRTAPGMPGWQRPAATAQPPPAGRHTPPPGPPPPGMRAFASGPPGPYPAHTAAPAAGAWSGGFIAGMILAGLFSCGLVPLIVGGVNYSDQSKRSQASTLIWVGVGILVLAVIGVALSSSAETQY
jgi:TIR domain